MPLTAVELWSIWNQANGAISCFALDRKWFFNFFTHALRAGLFNGGLCLIEIEHKKHDQCAQFLSIYPWLYLNEFADWGHEKYPRLKHVEKIIEIHFLSKTKQDRSINQIPIYHNSSAI